MIDASRHEYVDHKQSMEFEGYIIYVYSPEMIVCEKLRAICQQMPEYGRIIRRGRPSSARARDFVDVNYLVTMPDLDVTTDKYRTVIAEMFERKRVPLSLLGRIRDYREFHRADFAAVQATMSPNLALKDFDTYFQRRLDAGEPLSTALLVDAIHEDAVQRVRPKAMTLAFKVRIPRFLAMPRRANQSKSGSKR